MYVRYKRCKSRSTEDLLFPVYAGQDGSIVVFDTKRNGWKQLEQSHDKTNSYWVVSIPKSKRKNGKPNLEKDVHRLICIAWAGEPPSPTHRVDHVNGNPDDNTADNLRWITSLGNAEKANTHERSFPPSFRQIIIDCRKLRNGEDVLSSVSIERMDGTSVPAGELVGHGKGRPITRISSLLETLCRESAKGREKTGCEIDIGSIELDGTQPYPQELRARKDVVV